MAGVTDESRQSLWFLAASPLAWAAHFVASYATVAVWCARVAGREGSLSSARVAVAVYTALALAFIAAVAALGWRRHRFDGAVEPTAADTAAGRHRFVGSAAVLLSALSAVATLYSAMAVALIGSCH